ncbi:MAG: DUF1570 domain-containing protein [Fimbriiglobus sp.]|jgi:hypothetical protein|nr:DUF1570 domain-containing protein [Fimbriiglobus sp.]
MLRAFLILLIAAPLFGQPPGPSGDWPTDEVRIKFGTVFRGLILEESTDGVRFRIVRRPPGRPSITLTTTFTAAEVDRITRLSDDDRKKLRERLAALDADGAGEQDRITAIEFAPSDWLGKANAARRYTADQFVLVSGAEEDITRRAAVRLEKIYTAFARVLPPRRAAARPTRVDLADTLDDYRAVLQSAGVKVANAAVFFPTDNRIVCGSDLKRLGDSLRRTRLHHQQQRVALDRSEKELKELYKGSKEELDRFLGGVRKEREKIVAAERENEAAFDAATRRLFAILYHEAFHSYAAAFVFPPLKPEEVKAGAGTGELPRWLNEGLAQLFEDPVIEAGELRVGHADTARLKRVKEAAMKKAENGLVPLADLFRTGREQFVTAHAGETEVADRHYLTAWAVAHYLTFGRKVLGTQGLDDFLVAVNTGADPAKAFATLVGQDLPAFEKDWHDYLQRLQPDGTLRK